MDALGQLIDFSKLESSASFPYGILGYGASNINATLEFSQYIRMVILISASNPDSPFIYIITSGKSAVVGSYNNDGTTCRINGSISGTRLVTSRTSTIGNPNITAWFVIGG